MTHAKHWLGAAAIATLGLLASPSAALPAPTVPLLIKSGDLARDCVSEAALDSEDQQAIRFIVWCSVQSGETRFSLRRPGEDSGSAGAPILAFTARPETTGPGADGNFRCQRQLQSVRCNGRKRGPIVVRGRIVVPTGSRCAEPIQIRTAQADYRGLPTGCSGTPPWQPNFGLESMRRFRAELGFDQDLGGDQAAIDRRIRGLIDAWRRGEPVARVSALQYFQPFRAADQRRLEFRDELLERTANALERWVPGHAAESYAGYELDDQGDVSFYIGFTGDQEAQLAAFKREVKLFAPDHIKPFPVQPLYSERKLEAIQEELIDPPFDSPLERLINSLGIIVLPNKIEVGTEHVAKVKRLLAERYGPEGPFLVVFERTGIEF